MQEPLIRAMVHHDQRLVCGIVVATLRVALEEARADAQITALGRIGQVGSWHIAVIGEVIDGARVGTCLAARTRVRNPGALVLLAGAGVSRATLRAGLHAGCNGVCDLDRAEDLGQLTKIVAEYTRTLVRESRGGGAASVGCGAMFEATRAVSGLLRAWNQRLEPRLEGRGTRAA